MNADLFSNIPDRMNTASAKWDETNSLHYRNDLIPLSVADTDFKIADPIADALHNIIDMGALGYTINTRDFFSSIVNWYDKKHGVEIESEWIVYCPRINISCGLTADEFVSEGGKVMINKPCYSPLAHAIKTRGIELVENDLVKNDEGHYLMDLETTKKQSVDTDMFILVNPHNPTGRCWSKNELKGLVELSQEKNFIIFSDEIHGDIVAKGAEFNSILSLEGVDLDNIIVASSPSKTFNFPGLVISYLIIPNPEIRIKIENAIDRIGMHNPNIFSEEALKIAYSSRECLDWVGKLNNYIDENEEFIRKYYEMNFPELRIGIREGTFLLWVSYSKLNVSEEELDNWFVEQVGAKVSMASDFGTNEPYFRLNIGTSRHLLKKVCDLMKEKWSLISEV